MEFRSKIDVAALAARSGTTAFFAAQPAGDAAVRRRGRQRACSACPLDARGDFAGTLLDLLGPYPLLVGLLTVACSPCTAAIYLYLKTEGELQERLRELDVAHLGRSSSCSTC